MRSVNASFLSVLALFVTISGNSARADLLIVAPNAQAAAEGNSNNGFPFNLSPFGVSSQRYQQVYAASEFSALSGPSFIAQILFRPDALEGGAFSSTLPNVQVNLSTTTKAPDGLSTTFASNIGADDTIVFGAGPLSLSSAFTGPAGGPKNFDITINLTTPFLYDPASGNLLLDVRNFGGGRTTQFNAEFLGGDSVSRAYTVTTSGVNDASGSTDSLGLVTEFKFAPAAVPEPSSVVLFGTCLALTLGILRRRRARP
jgi:hypothetical protein